MRKDKNPGKRLFSDAFSDSEDKKPPFFFSQTSTPSSSSSPYGNSGSLNIGTPSSHGSSTPIAQHAPIGLSISSHSGSLSIGFASPTPGASSTIHPNFISPQPTIRHDEVTISPDGNDRVVEGLINFNNAQWEPIHEELPNTPQNPPFFHGQPYIYEDEIIGSPDEDTNSEISSINDSMHLEPMNSLLVRTELLMQGLPATAENFATIQKEYFVSIIKSLLEQGFEGSFYTTKTVFNEETESFDTIRTELSLDAAGNLVKFIVNDLPPEEEVDYSDMPDLEEANDDDSKEVVDYDDMPPLEVVNDTNGEEEWQVSLSFEFEGDDTTSASESEDGINTPLNDPQNFKILPGQDSIAPLEL